MLWTQCRTRSAQSSVDHRLTWRTIVEHAKCGRKNATCADKKIMNILHLNFSRTLRTHLDLFHSLALLYSVLFLRECEILVFWIFGGANGEAKKKRNIRKHYLHQMTGIRNTLCPGRLLYCFSPEHCGRYSMPSATLQTHIDTHAFIALSLFYQPSAHHQRTRW